MGDAVAQVRAAIGALYGADVARQKEANEFLVQHASTDAAWSTSLALVADDPSNPPDVQYFGANMMYGKVKGDWGKLPEPHRGPFVHHSNIEGRSRAEHLLLRASAEVGLGI